MGCLERKQRTSDTKKRTMSTTLGDVLAAYIPDLDVAAVNAACAVTVWDPATLNQDYWNGPPDNTWPASVGDFISSVSWNISENGAWPVNYQTWPFSGSRMMEEGSVSASHPPQQWRPRMKREQ
jgi:hypothetical protein